MDKIHFDKFHKNKSLLSAYIKIISLILPKIHALPKSSRHQKMYTDDNDDDDDDDDSDDDDSENYGKNSTKIGISNIEKNV